MQGNNSSPDRPPRNKSLLPGAVKALALGLLLSGNPGTSHAQQQKDLPIPGAPETPGMKDAREASAVIAELKAQGYSSAAIIHGLLQKMIGNTTQALSTIPLVSVDTFLSLAESGILDSSTNPAGAELGFLSQFSRPERLRLFDGKERLARVFSRALERNYPQESVWVPPVCEYAVQSLPAWTNDFLKAVARNESTQERFLSLCFGSRNLRNANIPDRLRPFVQKLLQETYPAPTADSLLKKIRENDDSWTSDFANLPTQEQRAAIARNLANVLKNIRERTEFVSTAADVLLDEYPHWKSGTRDIPTLEILGRISPFNFLTVLPHVPRDPRFLSIVALAAEQVSVSYVVEVYDSYADLAGAYALLLKQVHDVRVDHVVTMTLLERSTKITPRQMQQIQALLPSRVQIGFEVSFLLQQRRPDYQFVRKDKALDALSSPTFPWAVVAERSRTAPFDFDRWQEKLLAKERGFEFGTEVSRKKANIAREFGATWGAHPLLLAQNAAQAARYLVEGGERVTPENVARALDIILARRKEAEQISLAGNTVFATHNERTKIDISGVQKAGEPVFGNERQVRALREKAERSGFSFVHIAGDAASPVEETKRKIIEAGPSLRFYYFGHGGPSAIYFRDGGQDAGGGKVFERSGVQKLDVAGIVDALVQRYADPAKKPHDDVFFLGACYQYDFVRQMQTGLLRRGFGTPWFISAGEIGQVSHYAHKTPLGANLEKSWIDATGMKQLIDSDIDPQFESAPTIHAPLEAPKKGSRFRFLQISGADVTVSFE